MSFRFWMQVIALATVLAVVAGCASGIFEFEEKPPPTPEWGQDWGPCRRHVNGDGRGVAQIAIQHDSEDAPRGRLLATCNHSMNPFDVRVSGFFAKPHVKLWDSDGIELLSMELNFWTWPNGAFTSDGRSLYFTTKAGIMRFDIEKRTVEKQFEVDGENYILSGDGKFIAIPPKEDIPGPIRVFAVDSHEELCSLDAGELPVPVAILDSGRRLATRSESTGGKERFTVWDLETGAGTREFKPTNSRGTFSPTGSHYAADVPGNAVGIWNTESGEVVHTNGQHSSHVRATAFSQDGLLLASGSEGAGRRKEFGEVKVWEVATGAELATIIDDSSWGVTAVAFSPDGKELATGNGKGIVRFWKVPADLRATKRSQQARND